MAEMCLFNFVVAGAGGGGGGGGGVALGRESVPRIANLALAAAERATGLPISPLPASPISALFAGCIMSRRPVPNPESFLMSLKLPTEILDIDGLRGTPPAVVPMGILPGPPVLLYICDIGGTPAGYDLVGGLLNDRKAGMFALPPPPLPFGSGAFGEGFLD